MDRVFFSCSLNHLCMLKVVEICFSRLADDEIHWIMSKRRKAKMINEDRKRLETSEICVHKEVPFHLFYQNSHAKTSQYKMIKIILSSVK